MKCQVISSKDSDWLNLHMIVCIADNQPEMDCTAMSPDNISAHVSYIDLCTRLKSHISYSVQFYPTCTSIESSQNWLLLHKQ